MGNLQSVTDLTRLVQDVQYTTALKGMTEEQKQNYFNTQKQQLVGDILKDREGTFQKTFTDVQRNNSLQHSLFFYQQRNRDIHDLGKSIQNQNEAAIGTTRFNNQLATRQYEIIQWSYENKMETLFVFQILFVTILIASVLAYLHNTGLLSMTILGVLVGIMLFVDIVVLMNRYSYTKKLRDKRYWNKRSFEKKSLPQGSGSSICPPGEEPVTESQPGEAPPPST